MEPVDEGPGCGCGTEVADRLERTTLVAVLAINAVMFVVEAAAGWIAESTGLLADSLDMLADAGVYGVSLWAVGRSAGLRRAAGTASGYIQLTLGLVVLAEAVRRWLGHSEPWSTAMIVVGGVALLANLACLALLARHRHGEIHLRASWIFSTNDVLANLGIIVSGALVAWSGSRLPDLAVGALVSALVVRGGLRILAEARRRD